MWTITLASLTSPPKFRVTSPLAPFLTNQKLEGTGVERWSLKQGPMEKGKVYREAPEKTHVLSRLMKQEKINMKPFSVVFVFLANIVSQMKCHF